MKPRKRRRVFYPVCAKCGAELNPNKWDDCEKYYDMDGEIYCKDCFKERVLEWAENHLDEMAAVLDVPVIEIN